MVAIGVEIAFLPFQMQFQQREHLAHVCGIGIIAEMPKQFIHIVEIHVIVVHLVVAVGITTDIPIGIHLRAPFLFRTGKIIGFVLRRMRIDGRYIRYLTLGIGIEVGNGTVVPSQRICYVCGSPSCQWHSPTDTTVQPRFAIPQTISGSYEIGS